MTAYTAADVSLALMSAGPHDGSARDGCKCQSAIVEAGDEDFMGESGSITAASVRFGKVQRYNIIMWG